MKFVAAFLLTFCSRSVDDTRFDIAFLLRWNLSGKTAYSEIVRDAKQEEERAAYLNSPGYFLDDCPIDTSLLHGGGLRKLFLPALNEASVRGDKWSIIEEWRSGEVIRIFNFLVCYEKDSATISKYFLEFNPARWVCVEKRKIALQGSGLLQDGVRAPFGKGMNHGMVTVTDFSRDKPVRAAHFFEHTIADGSALAKVLKR